jgi:conjugal transfer ATP-binding protein TraC
VCSSDLIIDVGRSYKNTCEVLNGQFVEFSEKSQISLNPFSKIRTIEGSEELQILIPLIGQMASPGKKLGDWEKSTLERIIIQVFRQFGNRTTIDSIANALQAEYDQRAKDLGIQLFSYTSQGRRGKFFMGENNVDLSNPFIVLELEELKSDPDLQKVVLLLVLYNIAQEIYQGNGMARTIVIIDEAWSLLGDGPAEEFIETAYRRFRKYGASAITVTQGINDFYKTAATRACLENSDWMFLLRQRQESLTALKDNKRLILPEHVFDMLSTIHTISGQYSEVFINCSKGPAFGRLFIDDFSYWIYTTNPQERALLNTFKDAGLPLDETVEACIATKVLLMESLKRGRTPQEAIQLCLGDYMDKKKKYSDRQAKEREFANV